MACVDLQESFSETNRRNISELFTSSFSSFAHFPCYCLFSSWPSFFPYRDPGLVPTFDSWDLAQLRHYRIDKIERPVRCSYLFGASLRSVISRRREPISIKEGIKEAEISYIQPQPNSKFNWLLLFIYRFIWLLSCVFIDIYKYAI